MKRRIITSYDKLNAELKAAIYQYYPHGFEDKIQDHKDFTHGKYVKALFFDSNDTSYLIKFPNPDAITFLEEELEDDFSNDDEVFSEDVDASYDDFNEDEEEG